MSDAPAVISYGAELRRKALHLGALVLPVGILLVGREAVFVLAPLAAFAVACDWARVRWEPARRLLHGLFAPLMRPEEIPPLGGRVVLNGATWMCIAAALCAAVFAPGVAAAALAMQLVGDGAAAVVGRRFGRTRWPGSPKSVEGSAAFAATALLAGLGVAFWPGAGLTLGACLVGALAGAVAEAVPMGVNDNLRVPLVAGAAMALVLL